MRDLTMDPFDRHKPIAGPISRPIHSPALVPGQSEAERETGLVIGLVNNMPDSALKATERQFMRLVQTAAGKTPVRLHCSSVPPIVRSTPQEDHIERGSGTSPDLSPRHLDGLIVTGAEPIAAELPKE